MNVCMVVYSVYESDSRVVWCAETLAKLGHRVDVIALSAENRQGWSEIRGVHLFSVPIRKLNNGSPIAYLLRILWFFIHASALLTARELKKHYELVHVHSVPDFLAFAAIVPKLRGAKVVLDIHDIVPEFYLSKFRRTRASLSYRLLLWVERLSAAFADHVIVANDFWREKLVSRSVPEAKCSAILNFPDPAIFHRRGRSRSTGKVIVMYPGSLHWHQGVDIAVRAFSLIKAEAPSAEFHIYGAGPEEQALKKLADTLDVGDRVRFLGGRLLPEMAELMEGADLGIVPKRNEAFGGEAFSTKSLEFMCMGVPLVIADTKIDRHYFNDQVVQFFKAGDEKSLADAMLYLIRNPDVRERLVRNAAEFVARNGCEDNKHKYLNIVCHLTGSGDGRSLGSTSGGARRHSAGVMRRTLGEVNTSGQDESQAAVVKKRPEISDKRSMSIC